VFEYHGWATLRDASVLDDADRADRAGDCLLTATLAKVHSLIESTDVRNDFQVAELSHANGAWHLHLSGYRNHRQGAVVELWQRLAETAPAS
jgi:hypothetical protein